MDEASTEGEGGELKCSFCGKSQKEVRKLIAGPAVAICDECVALCSEIIASDLELQQKGPASES